MEMKGKDLGAHRAAVIGAGPAGLAAALTLSRALQDTIVFDAPDAYRNRDSPGVGAVLGRDGVLPQDLRGLGQQEIEGYGYARFVAEKVDGLEGDRQRGFTLVTAEGARAKASVVLLACGMVDIFPDLPGLSSFWGSSIINCPFCHGYELRQKPWGIFVHRPEMLEAAEIYRTWTDDLIFFLEPGMEPSLEREGELTAKGFGLERRRIRRFLGNAEGLSAVEVDDGTTVDRAAMVVWPHQKQCDLIANAGLALDDSGSVVVDEGYRTGVEGLYAAGDLLYQGHQNINTAIHMGNLAAATMVFDLAKTA